MRDRSRIKRLAREGVWIGVGQIASMLGSLALVRTLTGRLDAATYGELALGLTVAGLVNQVVTGGVNNGIARYYAIAAEKQELPGYISASRRLTLYTTLAVALIGLALLAGLWLTGRPQWTGLAAAALALSVLNGYNAALSGIQNAARQRAVVALHSGLDAWLKIAFALGALLWLGDSSTAAMAGYALSSLLVTGSQLAFVRRLVPRRSAPGADTARWARQIWSYSWPFSAWGLFTWMHLSSDRWALETFASTRDVGHYSVLFQLGYTPIAIAMGLAMNFLGPILYQRSGDATDRGRNAKVHKLVWRITSLGLLITLAGAALASLLHGWLFQILVAGQEYRAVSHLLPWMVLAGGLFAAGQMLGIKLSSELRSLDMLPAKIGTAALGLLLNVYGCLAAGIEGIVAAQLAFSAIYFVWMAFLAGRKPAKPGISP